mmetsp:Transcript_24680/g.55811  ORF Transcript_24680/g.55811 Transcript_24680/m.55811 type:complete len:280 (+) Transcript_24680:200-1039(+)
MRANNQLNFLPPAELCSDVRSESSDVVPPWIRMHPVVHESVRVRRVGPHRLMNTILLHALLSSWAMSFSKLSQPPAAMSDAAMQDQDRRRDDRRERKPSKRLQHLLVHRLSSCKPVQILARVPEAQGTHPLVHLSELVVAARQKHSRRIQNLESKQEHNHLKLVSASINKVPIEDVGCRFNVPPVVRREAEAREEQEKIAKLSMQISEDLAGRIDSDKAWLCHQPDTGSAREQHDLFAHLVCVVGVKESMQSCLDHPFLIQHVSFLSHQLHESQRLAHH